MEIKEESCTYGVEQASGGHRRGKTRVERFGTCVAISHLLGYGILRCELNRATSVHRVDGTDVRVQTPLSYIPGHVCDHLERKRLWVGEMRVN